MTKNYQRSNYQQQVVEKEFNGIAYRDFAEYYLQLLEKHFSRQGVSDNWVTEMAIERYKEKTANLLNNELQTAFEKYSKRKNVQGVPKAIMDFYYELMVKPKGHFIGIYLTQIIENCREFNGGKFPVGDDYQYVMKQLQDTTSQAYRTAYQNYIEKFYVEPSFGTIPVDSVILRDIRQMLASVQDVQSDVFYDTLKKHTDTVELN